MPIILTMLLTCLISLPAYGFTHMARTGETLEQLAVRYYGSTNKTMLLRAANGFVHPDDGRLYGGERVEIPEVTHYRIQDGDTWELLADRYLSSPSRAPFLAEMNGLETAEMPPVGTIIKIPYHLRHIFAKGESLANLVSIYYAKKRSVEWLRRYNNPSKKKYGQGEVIIVPLIDLVFTPEESARIDELRANRYSEKDLREQTAAREAIANLKIAYESGRYVEIVAEASRLIGYGKLTVPQEIGVQNYLAYAYVALGEWSLAVKTFQRALELQPEMELSNITNSPKVLKAFNEAKKALQKSGKVPKAPSGALDRGQKN